MKKSKRFLSVVLAVLMIISVMVAVPTTASAMTMDQFNARLNELRQKYPNGYVWNDTYHGTDGNWVQCKGFAHLMGYEVFGVDPGQWQIDCNINNVEPGDIVQYGEYNIGDGSNHSVFVIDVSGDTITFVDCNGNGNRNANGQYQAGLKMVLWGDTVKKSAGCIYGRIAFNYLRKAPWKKISTISYEANGGIGNMSQTNVEMGQLVEVSDCLYSREGYDFGGYNLYRQSDNKWYVQEEGWYSESDIVRNNYQKKVYSGGSSWRFDSSWLNGSNGDDSFVFYTVWKPNVYTVCYNANGGIGDMQQTNVEMGQLVEVSDCLYTREGYDFGGYNLYRESDKKWYVQEEGWYSESDIIRNNYQKKIYSGGSSWRFDSSWIEGASKNESFVFFTLWNKKSVPIQTEPLETLPIETKETKPTKTTETESVTDKPKETTQPATSAPTEAPTDKSEAPTSTPTQPDSGKTEKPTEPVTNKPENPSEAPEKIDISDWNVEGLEDVVYTGKVIKPEFDVVNDAGEYAEFTEKFKNNKKVGTATVTITGIGDYTGTIVKTFNITKAKQPMTVNAVTKKASRAKLKITNVKVKPLTIKNAQGAFSCKKLTGSKFLTVSKKGVITVKKGAYNRGTILKIKVKITAKGDSSYKSGAKTVTAKIKIK